MFKINYKNLISFVFATSIVFVLNLLVLLPNNANAYYHVGWEDGEYVGYYDDSNNGGSGNWSNDDYNPNPSVTSVSPNSITKNSNITITVKGRNFTPESNIRLNDHDLNTSFINSSTLTAQLNSYELGTIGSYSISVFNPAPGGGYSNAITFKVTNPTNASANTTSKAKTSVVSSTANQATSANSKTIKETSDQESELASNAIFGSSAFMPSSLVQWIFFFILILLIVVLWRKLFSNKENESVPLKHA
ncbi:MAG TPA: IPT/TIG domain-containing protein [Candidatus Paceibacterota bacterium]|nr:IPT/TIG domain-containing protein [Candidatus Paceibacterota bacterium]HPT18184.1 IPT/TIG domain-containing protein [Candidatus Paceibacterota bacterium]